MEIEHTLDGTQMEYGYIWWKAQGERKKYMNVFPEGEFTLDLEGEKFTKHVDWKRGRVSIGKQLMQEHFKRGDTIIISKCADAVAVRKKPITKTKEQQQVERVQKARELAEKCVGTSHLV